MSIRKTLLAAFVSVGLLSAALISALAFVDARQALRSEIERSLLSQANGVAAEIDKMMFERLQNAATWSHLDIMQDLQVHDVDKRLSHFLADLQAGYGEVYLSLSCLNDQAQVISSSDAALVGQTIAISAPTSTAPMSGADVSLALTGNGRTGDAVMTVPLRSAFTDVPLGSLRLHLDWTRISDVLDHAGSATGRSLALIDAQGHLVAASESLRQRGLTVGSDLSAWRGPSPSVQVLPGGALMPTPLIVGSGRSHGYAHFAGFGWTTLVIQPVDMAYAPVHRMAMIFLALLAGVLLCTGLTAAWVSHTIAAPILALTAYARGYLRTKTTGAPPTAGAGEVGELTTAFVSMVRDIAQSQQNLVRASKLAVVGEMSAIIAHEVRTPLGILRSSAQMLRREPGLSAEGRELISFIESETERLNRLVSSMLDAARPRAASFSVVDVHALIHHAAGLLQSQAAQHQVEIRLRTDARQASIACDREQITQVLLNILLNGLQILHHGGVIDVSTRDAGEQLCIEIADNGPGIDPGERAKIFEAFFFRREGGVGLGLAIVQQIVLDHGGDIEAGESPMGGALFKILLPHQHPESE